MAIKETKQTEQDLNDEVRDVEGKKLQALSAILPTLDLPEEENPDDELQELRDEEERENRKKQEEGQDKAIKKNNKEEDTKETEETDEDEDPTDDLDEDEELIPKSKVNKRFKQLTAKIKALEAKEALKAQQPQTNIDADMAKLEAMTPEQLKQTLRDVRTKSLSIATSDDPADREAIGDYVDLEMKIHNAMSTYNQRFYNAQVAEMNAAVEAINYDEDIEDTETALVEIKKIAEGIYQKHPQMQQLRSGMKQAYELATDHYKIIQGTKAGKTKSKRVERENTRLKRKTTLDASKIKGKPTSRKLDLLRKKLNKGATDTDRTEFVKESPLFSVENLLPDEFKN